MQAGDEVATFDLDVVQRFADLAVEGLAGAREEIDALNVYPVPDGDTGTNLFLTVEAASEVVDELPADAELAAVLPALARAALLGARGNSGVILSQMFKGFADAMADRRGEPADVAAGLLRAAEAAYAAVANPVEGTMLSVLRAAAEAAAEQAN